MHVALGKKKVMFISCGDVGNSEPIALDRHRVFQACNDNCAVHRGKRLRHKVAKDEKRHEGDNNQRTENSDDNF